MNNNTNTIDLSKDIITEQNTEVNTEVVNAEVVNAEEVNTEVVNAEEVNAEVVNAEVVNAEVVNAEEVNAEEVNTEEVNTEVTEDPSTDISDDSISNNGPNDEYSETLFTSQKMGFIISRHVRDVTTNYYWNFAVQSIRKHYPKLPIVIIDDNSNYNFVKQFTEYTNVKIINSEFNGRGELLPYIYLLKYRFFENALIMHDSVFIHKPINFNNVIQKGIKVLPIWYFYPDKENLEGRLNIASHLTNYFSIKPELELSSTLLLDHAKWYGCFGVQSFINTNFLMYIEKKYRITNLVGVIKCRLDRQCLERIMGCIFFKEFKVKDKHGIRKSLLGNIMKYQTFGYTLENYISDLKNNNIKKSFIKVWTGR